MVAAFGPVIRLAPRWGRFGTVVVVSGIRFAPAEAGTFAVPCPQVSSPTDPAILTAVGACTFTARGVLLCFTFTVGNVAPGWYVIEVTGFTAGDIGQAVFFVL